MNQQFEQHIQAIKKLYLRPIKSIILVNIVFFILTFNTILEDIVRLIIFIILFLISILLILYFYKNYKDFRWVLNHYKSEKETSITLIEKRLQKKMIIKQEQYIYHLNSAYDALK